MFQKHRKTLLYRRYSISPYSNTSWTAKWATKNAWPKAAMPAGSRSKICSSTTPRLSIIGFLKLMKEVAEKGLQSRKWAVRNGPSMTMVIENLDCSRI